MINIIVVDDEPINADGIAIYLAEHGETDWNIITYYGAGSALASIRQRVDVLVSDIMMPVVDGFYLHEQLLQRWPRMRTVFLTGYPQMEYIQKAIRSENVIDYVLKTEDEETILAAVRKAVQSFQDNMHTQDLLSKAAEDIQKARPLLQRDLLYSILKQKIDRTEALSERFDKLSLPLHADKPVLLLLAQPSQVMHQENANELACFALENIMEKYLWPAYRIYSITLDNHRMIFFLQSTTRPTLESVKQAFSLLEGVQQTYNQTIGLLSMALANQYCSWLESGQHYHVLINTLERNIALDDNSLIMQSDEELSSGVTPYAVLFELRALLDNQEYERAAICLQHIDMPQSPQAKIDLYRRLLKLYSLTVSAREDAAAIYQDCRVPALLLDDEGWKRTISTFASLFASLSRLMEDSSQKSTLLVARIKEYVHNHLADDLSLTKIAEVTDRSASNLSKVFKQVAGIGYNEYIVEQRMNYAAHLLREKPSFKLSDVASAVGYSTPSYFIRVFREHFGTTPSEFRKNAAARP